VWNRRAKIAKSASNSNPAEASGVCGRAVEVAGVPQLGRTATLARRAYHWTPDVQCSLLGKVLGWSDRSWMGTLNHNKSCLRCVAGLLARLHWMHRMACEKDIDYLNSRRYSGCCPWCSTLKSLACPLGPADQVQSSRNNGSMVGHSNWNWNGTHEST